MNKQSYLEGEISLLSTESISYIIIHLILFR